MNSGKLDNPNIMMIIARTTYGSAPFGCSKLVKLSFYLEDNFYPGSTVCSNDALGTVTPQYSIIFICMLSVIEL